MTVSEPGVRSFVPLTDAERDHMLARIGAESVDSLFEAVPAAHRFPEIQLPRPLSELEIMAELRAMSETNVDVQHASCFLGAGAYNHFVPSVVDHVLSRSEFYTAYTPYQPEVSQGTLQAIFEYQTMICALTGMEVSNASHYDGATATAEAVIMAVSASRGRRRKAIVARGVHPEYLLTARTYLQGADVEVIGDEDSSVSVDGLLDRVDGDTACLVLQTPDFFGRMVDLRGLADRVHAKGAMFVVVCDPISLGMLEPPGSFDADIVLGEGQPLGNPLSYGGPYVGFFACRKDQVRRMAGRLVGQTVDAEGRRGYALTLSTREQHIRRERASSNICTNQGLNALAAAVYMAALGPRGLAQVARLCYHKAHYAAERIDALEGYTVDQSTPFFKEFVVDCPCPVSELNRRLLQDRGIVGGYDLGRAYPERRGQMLVCVTEMNSRAQIDGLVEALREAA